MQGRDRQLTAKQMIATLQQSKESVMEELLKRDLSITINGSFDVPTRDDTIDGDCVEKLPLIQHDSSKESAWLFFQTKTAPNNEK